MGRWGKEHPQQRLRGRFESGLSRGRKVGVAGTFGHGVWREAAARSCWAYGSRKGLGLYFPYRGHSLESLSSRSGGRGGKEGDGSWAGGGRVRVAWGGGREEA